MRRLMVTAAAMLAMALRAPVSRAQVQAVPAPDSHRTTSRSSVVPATPQRHTGVMPTPIGVSPVPAPAFPTPTPIGVPPMLPLPGTNNVGFGNGHHHHRHDGDDGFFGGAYPVYVPVPVVVDPYSEYQGTTAGTDDPNAGMNDQDDNESVVAGPTVFERRTPADMSSVAADPGSAPPTAAAEAPGSLSAAPPVAADSGASSQPAQPQPASVLVFRDGHQLEIENYAIVGDTLYDLTPGHARKVPLSQLDLPATVKANDDRGVDFPLPVGSKGE